MSIEDVGPTWGGEISRKAAIGLLVVLAAITLYITLRFELKMAIGAIIALIHDVIDHGRRLRARPGARSPRRR